MKFVGIFLLAALVVAIIAPVTVCASASPSGHVEYIASLDVCGSSAPFVSAASDIPSLHQCPSVFLPFETADFLEPADPLFTSFLVAVSLEQPPRV